MKEGRESEEASGVGRSAKLDARLASLLALAPSGCAHGLNKDFGSALNMVQTRGPNSAESCTPEDNSFPDPKVACGFAEQGAQRRSAPVPCQTLQQAAVVGLSFGVAVSDGRFFARSVGGFARADRDASDDWIAQSTELVRVLHQETTPPEQLSPVQAEALHLIADGYRPADAAAQLEISESAQKARLRTARERLLCRTTAEAIQRAAANKLF